MELALKDGMLNAYTSIGQHYETVCGEIREKKVQIHSLRREIERLLEKQRQEL